VPIRRAHLGERHDDDDDDDDDVLVGGSARVARRSVVSVRASKPWRVLAHHQDAADLRP
jgi:hypothetical protein